ncbi:MAG: hypothetical protein GY858_00335 [Candidatus Omnitrophica bacterium]|nr:hypothetical protein [Candidatus Omnitrophota bacterium]
MLRLNNKLSTLRSIGFMLFIFCLTGNVLAEKIYLKSGGVVEGEIISRTNESIQVDLEGVVLTYYLDEIEYLQEEVNSDEQGQMYQEGSDGPLSGDQFQEVLASIFGVSKVEKKSKIREDIKKRFKKRKSVAMPVAGNKKSNTPIDTQSPKFLAFKRKFKRCIPANYQMDFMNGAMVFDCAIIGPTDNGCKVSVKAVKAMKPELEGKKMICDYDNSLDFEKVITDVDSCSGGLKDLMSVFNSH